MFFLKKKSPSLIYTHPGRPSSGAPSSTSSGPSGSWPRLLPDRSRLNVRLNFRIFLDFFLALGGPFIWTAIPGSVRRVRIYVGFVGDVYD